MTSQLCQTINDFWPDLNASENDIKNPTTAFLKRFFEKFFEECALSEIMMEKFPNDKVLYPALIKETLPLISTSVFLRNIFSWMNGPQFGIDDIIDPNKKRTVKLIELLSNFLAYVDCYAGPYSNQVMAESDEKVLEKETLSLEIDKLKEKLNECALLKAEHSTKLKLAEENKSQLCNYLESLNKVKEEKEAEYNAMQAILSEEKDELKALQQVIEKEMADIQVLREKVVSSPDTISRQKVELISMKREVESNHMQQLKLAKDKQRVDTHLDELITKIQPRLTLVEDLSKNITFSRNLEKGLVTDEENLKNAKDKILAATEEMNATMQKIAHLDNEEKEMRAKHENTRSCMAKAYQQALKRKAEAEQEQLKQGAHQVLVAQEIDMLKETISSVDKEREEFGKFFLEQDKLMSDSFNRTQDRLKGVELAIWEKLKK